ncbi:MAG TPA: hypothetical protein VH021_18305 [Trebonia sp.]|nr:hypothetical protein [Trebonia sp.]
MGARGTLPEPGPGGGRVRGEGHAGRAGRLRTDWSGSSAKHAAEQPAYDHVRETAAAGRKARYRRPGDPTATRQAILTLVDSANPPLRMFLGEAPLAIATADYDSRLAAWREWQPVAAAAQG